MSGRRVSAHTAARNPQPMRRSAAADVVSGSKRNRSHGEAALVVGSVDGGGHRSSSSRSRVKYVNCEYGGCSPRTTLSRKSRMSSTRTTGEGRSS